MWIPVDRVRSAICAGEIPHPIPDPAADDCGDDRAGTNGTLLAPNAGHEALTGATQTAAPQAVIYAVELNPKNTPVLRVGAPRTVRSGSGSQRLRFAPAPVRSGAPPPNSLSCERPPAVGHTRGSAASAVDDDCG